LKQKHNLKSSLFEKDIEISGLENNKAVCLKEIERESVSLEVAAMEEKQLLDETEEFKDEVSSSETRILALEGEENSKNLELVSLRESLDSLKEEMEILRQKLTEQRVLNVSFKEKRQNLEKELENLLVSKNETVRRLERDKKLLSDASAQSGKLVDEISEFREALVKLTRHHKELEQSLSEKRDRYEQLTESARMSELELRKLHKSHDEIRGKISEMKVSVAEKEMEIRHLLEGLYEKYNVNLLDTIDEFDAIPQPDEGAEKRLQLLNNSIAGLGEVNLTALYEHSENMERLSFLQKQEEDLVEAMESLKKAIGRINMTSRKRFRETFEAINVKFRELFPSLFRGGKAELVLTEENLLETGVDIVAQPPGKKLQSINLLSGGEKALTAITLIFSIFLIKPSPFCLLDEVDAPLDDANVGRFNELVKKMSAVSQIILITHNKRSIQIGDTLYGITMEDPGISKLVSVKLN